MSSLVSEELMKDVEIKKLLDEEKRCRQENEFEKSKVTTKKILETLHNRKDFDNYLKIFEYLSQRRNQSRESIVTMVKYSLNDVLSTLNTEKQAADLLTTIIIV